MWAGTVAEGRLGVNVRLVFALHFRFEIFRRPAYSAAVTVETFEAEINDALRAYDKHIVCIDKPTVDCRETLRSLIEKAIIAYETRGPHLRHGIALDKHVTIILSQSQTDRPLCGIYFNLVTPYYQKQAQRAVGAHEGQQG